jgi:uncharacterized protein Yka (UPF0111/DUF47 family)
MSFWKKLLGKDEKFYDLLEACAAEAHHGSSLLVTVLDNLSRNPESQNLDDLIFSRRKDKKIKQQITEELCRTFVTPLEREDIETLSSSLYKIPKTVLKVAERLLICQPALLQDQDLHRQVKLLEQSSEVVAGMVRLLRAGANLEKVQEMNGKLQYLEGEADKLVIAMLKELCSGERDAKEVIILKDLFELLERAIDRCRDAGNTVFQVVLKNS